MRGALLVLSPSTEITISNLHGGRKYWYMYKDEGDTYQHFWKVSSLKLKSNHVWFFSLELFANNDGKTFEELFIIVIFLNITSRFPV